MLVHTAFDLADSRVKGESILDTQFEEWSAQGTLSDEPTPAPGISVIPQEMHSMYVIDSLTERLL
jgi:hypothetical protein